MSVINVNKDRVESAKLTLAAAKTVREWNAIRDALKQTLTQEEISAIDCSGEAWKTLFLRKTSS